jgi:glycosyltransferase involved in cell wall biosynthesis
MTARPRLLLVAAFFPPAPTVASVRAWGMAKYLARRGWQVSVLTPEPRVNLRPDDAEGFERELEREGVTRLAVRPRWRRFWFTNLPPQGSFNLPFRIVRRVARLIGMDPEQAWFDDAERVGLRLTPGDVDVVLATGGPFGNFRVGARLAARLGRPLVLDYRDSWTDNPLAWYVVNTKRDHAEQSAVLAAAAEVVAVSPSLAELVSKRGGGRPVHVVTNGYDPDHCGAVSPAAFGHFAIVYTGSIYAPRIVMGPLFEALRRLDSEGDLPEWRFHYYGGYGRHVARAAARAGIAHKVVMHGVVPRREALAAVAGAGVAVVIASVRDDDTIGDRAIVTGKLFEPLGLRVPTLLIAPAGSDIDAIAARTGLITRFTGSDIEGMKAFLSGLLRGQAPSPAREPEAYSWPVLAERLDAVLRPLVDGRSR